MNKCTIKCFNAHGWQHDPLGADVSEHQEDHVAEEEEVGRGCDAGHDNERQLCNS